MAMLRWICGTILLFGLMLSAVMLLPSSEKTKQQSVQTKTDAKKLQPQSQQKLAEKPVAPKPKNEIQNTIAAEPLVTETPRNVGRGFVPLPLDENLESLERIAPLEIAPQPKRKPQPVRLSGIIISTAGKLTAQGKAITLEGIVPTSSDQICGDGSNAWPCGIYARSAFRRFVRGRSVTCDLLPTDQSATTRCMLGRSDIAEWLATYGWAEAESGSSYAALTDAAKTNKIGIFADQP